MVFIRMRHKHSVHLLHPHIFQIRQQSIRPHAFLVAAAAIDHHGSAALFLQNGTIPLAHIKESHLPGRTVPVEKQAQKSCHIQGQAYFQQSFTPETALSPCRIFHISEGFFVFRTSSQQHPQKNTIIEQYLPQRRLPAHVYTARKQPLYLAGQLINFTHRRCRAAEKNTHDFSKFLKRQINHAQKTRHSDSKQPSQTKHTESHDEMSCQIQKSTDKQCQHPCAQQNSCHWHQQHIPNKRIHRHFIEKPQLQRQKGKLNEKGNAQTAAPGLSCLIWLYVRVSYPHPIFYQSRLSFSQHLLHRTQQLSPLCYPTFFW